MARLNFESREEKIIESAMALFSEKGFSGTTTKSIASKAGINEALLFRHFKTKEDLYCAILRKRSGDWETKVVPLLEETKSLPLEEALKRLVSLIIARNRKEPQILRMMFFSSLEGHELSRMFFKQRLLIVDFLSSFFEERKARGEIKGEEPAVLARTFLALVYHYIIITQILKTRKFYPKPESETAADFIRIFLRGIQA